MRELSRNIGWSALALSALGLVFYEFVSYYILGPTHGFFQQRLVYETHLAGLYTHITGSMIALLLGPFQFLNPLRRKFGSLHRWFGRIYLLGVLTGGLGGLYMAWYSYGGFPSHLGFTCLSLLWLMTGFTAYSSIRNRNIIEHKKWMIRNFTLTFTAVMLRAWLGLFAGVFNIPFTEAYVAVSWFSWVPNVIIMEFIISKTKIWSCWRLPIKELRK